MRLRLFGGLRVKKNLTEINHKVSVFAKRFVAPFGVRSQRNGRR
jgi:hypothetical protein